MVDQVPPWLASQRADLGQEEIPGPANNPRIIAKARLPGVKFPNVDGIVAYGNEYTSDDKQAWCGAETGGSLAEVGIMPPFRKGHDTESYLWADSFITWGAACDMRVGAVCTFGGHVGMVDEIIDADTFWCIGGNQGSPNGGAVTRSKRSRSSVRAFRWPDDASLQQAGLIEWSLAAASGAVTTTTRPLIKAGSTGGFVTELQKILGLGPTGIFDASTDTAVRSFQAVHGLEVDGEVGPLTWAALLGTSVTIAGDVPHAAEYHDQWQRMVVAPDRVATVDTLARKLLANKARYKAAVMGTTVPWWFIAPIHERESSCNFSANIHNGQPLGQVTTLEPKGRGPFSSFEASVADWIRLKALDKIANWPVERVAYQDELNNGMGYRNKGVPSAYLWSFSNIYTGGKYVADHVWSAVAVDKQCGTMPLLKKIMELDASVVLAAPENKPVTDPTAAPAPATDIVPAQPTIDLNQIVGTIEQHSEKVRVPLEFAVALFNRMHPDKPLAGTVPTPTVAPAPAPTPATPTLQRPSVQLGALGLLGTLVMQVMGVIDPPSIPILNMVGSTVGTLLPILTGGTAAVGATGAFSGLASIASKILGALIKNPK